MSTVPETGVSRRSGPEGALADKRNGEPRARPPVRITILDPTAPAPDIDSDPGPSPSALGGCRVGIRSDRTWRSFEWVADEWERALRREGAVVQRWVSGNRIGDEGERTRAELAAFVASNDLVITGLGN